MKMIVCRLVLFFWASCPILAASRSLADDSFEEQWDPDSSDEATSQSIFANSQLVGADGSRMDFSAEMHKWFLETLIKNRGLLSDFDGFDLLPPNELKNNITTTNRKLGEISMKRHLAPEGMCGRAWYLLSRRYSILIANCST